MFGALLGIGLRDGLVAVGDLEPVHNAVDLAASAKVKGAETPLIPVTSRRQIADLADEMATRQASLTYADAREVLLKALVD